jgi:hypothetical protein
MHLKSLLRLLSRAAALAALAGCDHSPSTPTTLPEDRIVLVKAAPGAPPLEKLHLEFWARAGDTRQVEIRYEPTGAYSGDPCLQFTIPSNGLYRKPDGTAFQKGDSVLIKIDVVDPARFDFQFAPSGLQFDPSHPAEMRVSYKWVADDANDDGVVDAKDDALRRSLGIWGREAAGGAWTRLSTTRDSDGEELRARIPGFSQYAMAGGN